MWRFSAVTGTAAAEARVHLSLNDAGSCIAHFRSRAGGRRSTIAVSFYRSRARGGELLLAGWVGQRGRDFQFAIYNLEMHTRGECG